MHPVRPRARRRAVAQRTNVKIAPMGPAGLSEIGYPARSSVDRRCCSIGFGCRSRWRRLATAACSRPLVADKPLKESAASLDAWALVDTLNQPRALISNMISALAVFIRPASDREFNVDVANEGTLIGAPCVAWGASAGQPRRRDDVRSAR